MSEKYDTVPNIISCKDLDYLSDMFNWNYGAYKKALNASKNVSDESLGTQLENISTIFRNELDNILNIINEGGQNGQQSN